MKVIDISLPVSSRTPHWPTDAGVRLTRTSTIGPKKHSNDTHLAMSLHAGTHYDAPLHFLSKGQSIDKIPLSVFAGSTYVAYLPRIRKITALDLEKSHMPKGTTRILLKTENSRRWGRENASKFRKDYVGLSADAAQWLVRRKVKLVGIDYLSVAAYDEIVPVHRILLGARVAILEGLDLRKAPQGRGELIAYPLYIPGTEAAPTRALLLTV